MIVNPGKFQAIILDKKKNNHTQEIIKNVKNDVKVKSSVKLLGVQIDSELNFTLHIANICRSAANELNALIRLKNFSGFQEKKVLINSYFYSNFNYCPLVWMFSHAKSLKKVEALQKRALRFLYDDYNSPSEEILKKSGKFCVELNRLRYLCIEIYKTINNINPSFMKQIFQLRETNRTFRNQYKPNLNVSKVNQASYGEKSLRYMDLKSGTPFRSMLRLVKILKLSKILLKIGMVVHVTVGYVRVELIFFKVFPASPAPVNILHTTHKTLMLIHTKIICF